MWGYSIQFWQSTANWLLLATALFGALAVIASFTASVISGEALKRLQIEADEKIAAANARSEEARADAARATEHTARLEAEAEQARLETERLKLQLAWRRLNDSQSQTLTEKLKDFPAGITLETIANDPEATLFASDIRRALKAAGITLRLQSSLIAATEPIIGIEITGPRLPSVRIAEAFASIGFDVVVDVQDSDINILIGSKPPPQLQ